MSIKVRCYRVTKNKPGQAISNDMIVTQEMAEKRGKRFLDDPDQGNYYGVKNHSLKCPYKSGVYPGKFVTVTSSKLGLADKLMRVKSVKITGAYGELSMNLELQEFLT